MIQMLDEAKKYEPLTNLNLYKHFYCFSASYFFGCEMTKNINLLQKKEFLNKITALNVTLIKNTT